MQSRLPFTAVLDFEGQPIAVGEVATRLAELADGVPAKRVPDIGGPERLHFRTLARHWQETSGRLKPIRSLPLGGKTIRAFQAGHHMTPLPAYGVETFRAYAEGRPTR